jgi:lipoate---protein ligase
MNLLHCTLESPAANLACDEALLDICEQTAAETLRFWESPTKFVVVGYGNSVAVEVDQAACSDGGVPILRRCSGGGTVVQGPGCLNYALTLRADDEGPLATVTGTNLFIMEQNRRAFQKLLPQEVTVEGHTDLAIREATAPESQPSTSLLKFSGNAQRRRRQSVLFHGTILYNFDLSRIAQLLKAPSKQPDYRANRQHGQFVTNIPCGAKAIMTALTKAWNAVAELQKPPLQEVERLVRERYSTAEWNAAR